MQGSWSWWALGIGIDANTLNDSDVQSGLETTGVAGTSGRVLNDPGMTPVHSLTNSAPPSGSQGHRLCSEGVY